MFLVWYQMIEELRTQLARQAEKFVDVALAVADMNASPGGARRLPRVVMQRPNVALALIRLDAGEAPQPGGRRMARRR